MPTLDHERIRHAFDAGPATRFAALFGSQATGKARDHSDVDIAWLPVDRDVPLADELALQVALTRALGREVDLVRTDRTSTICRMEIARDGQLLYGDQAAFTLFKVEATIEFLDFEPAWRQANELFQRRLAERAGQPAKSKP